MEKFILNLMIVLVFGIGTYSLQAQDKNDREVLERVYSLLQTRGTGLTDVIELTSAIDWTEVKTSKQLNERYAITFPGMMRNDWTGLHFQDMVFMQTEKDRILATGRVSGRQPTECGIVTTSFAHSWSFQDGEIVGFSE